MAGLLGVRQEEDQTMHATCEFVRTDVDDALVWARRQTDGWGVPPSFVAQWLTTAGDLLPASATGRVELSYDAAMGLLSLDVWCGEARVYGMDDWVS